MGRVEELRKQALTDYEREVSQHAAKLEEMRVMRAKVAETEERSRQAVEAAEEARKATAREAVCVARPFSMSLILVQGVLAGRVGKSQRRSAREGQRSEGASEEVGVGEGIRAV